MSDAGRDDRPPVGEADAIAAVVLAEPGVARLSGGPVATYLSGHRVPGVRLSDGEVEVHLVARWVPSLPELAERVRAALRPTAGDRTISVMIDDLEADPPVAELAPPADESPVPALVAPAAIPAPAAAPDSGADELPVIGAPP